MSATPVQPETGTPVRPDVLALPSPTTSRYLVFVAALVASGLFVGNYLHGIVWGEGWQATVARCMTRPGWSADPVAGTTAFNACTADAERFRAGVIAGGALGMLVVAVGLMWLAPLLVLRRRRLRPLPASLQPAADRFHELARAAGVRGRVDLLLGPSAQRDAFSFGAPGHHRVALPPAAVVRWRDRTLFDPLLLHELAHVRHRDVALAWLTRLVWWVLVPLLGLPVLVAALEQDFSILGGYLWRVSLLAAVVALLSSDLLRSREHDADLRAVQLSDGPAPMLGLVGRIAGDRSGRLGRLLAKHPTAEHRAAVLERPTLVTRTGWADGLTGGFLSAMAMPLLVASLTPLLAASGQVVTAYTLGAALLGPLLAGSVGMGLWRAALMTRLGGPEVPVGRVAAGVGVGLVLGQAVSLQQVGLGTVTGTSSPAWLLATGVAGAGAVVVSTAAAHLWADAAPRLSGPRPAWVLALLVNSVLFGVLLWACTLFQSSVDLAGWALARQALLSTLAPWWAAAAAGVLAAAAAAAMVAAAPGVPAPAWLLEHGRPGWPAASRLLVRTVLLSCSAAVAGAGVLVGYRLVAGPTEDPAVTLQRFQAYQWLAALVAAGLLVALAHADRDRGPAAALVGAPIAVTGVLLGFLALNTALGGGLSAALVGEFLRPALVLGLYGSLLVAPLVPMLTRVSAAGRAARSRPPGPRPRPRTAATLALAVLLVVPAAAAALVARDTLVGPPQAGPTVPVEDPLGDAEDLVLLEEVASYESGTAPDIEATYDEAVTRAGQLLADSSLSAGERGAALTAEVLDPLRSLAARSARIRPGHTRVAGMHRQARLALALAVDRFRLLASTGAVLDGAEAGRHAELQRREAEHWAAWSAQRRALFEEVTAGR